MRKELIILSGFLGSGKTTLLRSLLLRHSDRKIAVLLNDFGDIPVDGETLRRSGVEGGVVVEIGGGSVFCSCLREPFIKALANLAARDEDLIIVEASGMSDPSAWITLQSRMRPSPFRAVMTPASCREPPSSRPAPPRWLWAI